MKKHPRVCGEDFSGASKLKDIEETPPRMRGRPRTAGAVKPCAGNTPAYAGKTGGKLLKDCRA